MSIESELIERVANIHIRGRLLIEQELTLPKDTSLALKTETGLRNASVLPDSTVNTTTAATPASVRAVNKQQRKNARKTKWHLFHNQRLQLLRICLFTYSREKTPVKWCMRATVTQDGDSITCSFIVVKSGTALLGLDLFAHAY